MKSLSTPDLSCISDKDKDFVYEPAEDTFLLLDALELDQERILSSRPTLVLEVGCGSGVVSTFVSKLLGKESPALILCTDINVKAAELARRLSSHNHHCLQVVLTNLVSAFDEQLQNKVDIMIFNPPYVVTPSSEVGTLDLSASWAGGLDGREVLDQLLPNIHKMLSDNGVFYLVAIKENKIDEIQDSLQKNGLGMTVVMTRRTGPELLYILRFEKNK